MTNLEPTVSGVYTSDRRDGGLALLPSELTTIAIGLYAFVRFYGTGTVTGLLQIEAITLWTAAAIAEVTVAALRGAFGLRRFLVRILALCALAVLMRFQCSELDWPRAIAVVIGIGTVLAGTRWLLCRAAAGTRVGWADGWRGAGLQGVAIYALQPYVVSTLVGAGDAYHYSLMLSDAVGQFRSGVFPLFVGQTPYAFNGNIHTLRTAPLYEYIGAGFDLLTLRTLPVCGLQNLILFTSAGLGAVGGYAALRRYAPELPWVAAGLASLYVLCPGVLAPLYEGDMIATFLTVPAIPWLVLGIAKATDEPEKWEPWLIMATALAALWWAHPPVAFWASLLVLGSWLIIVIRTEWNWRNVLRMSVATLLFALLAGYVFESVHSLQLRAPNVIAAQEVAGVMQSVADGWRPSLRPITGYFIGDLQLGYALMAGVLVGCLALRSRRSAGTLLAGLAACLMLLWPIPIVTARLWSWAPMSVLTVTNRWPMQRLYVILAGLAVFLALAGLAHLSRRSLATRLLLGIGLVIAIGWSSREAYKFVLHGRIVTSSRENSERTHRPENLTLTTSSYLVFNFLPTYFSNGVMEPFLETRLRDPRTFEVTADGSTPIAGQQRGKIASFELKIVKATRILDPKIRLMPGHTSLLHFDFLGRQHEGSLTLTGESVWRLYTLPSSGMESSFGAGPSNSRVVAINNDKSTPEDLTLYFYPKHPEAESAGPFARVAIEWLDAQERAIRLRSLVPFEVDVRSERPAILETPKIFVPGYRATVNGHLASVVETGEGLVAVAVPAGQSFVRVEYPGSIWLRLTFYASSLGWLCSIAAFVYGHSLDKACDLHRQANVCEAWLLSAFQRWGSAALAVLALTLAGIFLWQRVLPPPSGSLRLGLMMPLLRPGIAEPLLTTGHTGAGDVIYLKYVGGGYFCIGHDKWSYGGAVSAPFFVDATHPQTVEISMSSLGSGHGVHVWWNGREVIDETTDSYGPAPLSQVEIGVNRIGSTTCGTLFTGRILESKRSTSFPVTAADPRELTP
jgi:hypothetical protein